MTGGFTLADMLRPDWGQFDAGDCERELNVSDAIPGSRHGPTAASINCLIRFREASGERLT